MITTREMVAELMWLGGQEGLEPPVRARVMEVCARMYETQTEDVAGASRELLMLALDAGDDAVKDRLIRLVAETLPEPPRKAASSSPGFTKDERPRAKRGPKKAAPSDTAEEQGRVA